MKRREFLASSMALAAGCTSTAPATQRKPTLHPPAASKGVQILFHGLNLFVIPDDEAVGAIDVAFVDTRLNDALAEHVHLHIPALRINKAFVYPSSDAVPAAADETHAYYALRGSVQMIASTSPDVADGWRASSTLKWKDTSLKDRNPKDCPRGNDWNNLQWLLDFRDLHKTARLPSNWRTGKEFLGVLSLRSGELETDRVPHDNSARYRYDVNGKQRLLKDMVRCYVPDTSDFVQFKFGVEGQSTSLVIPCQSAARMVGLDVYHLPTPGMDPGAGALTDYWAVYEALVSPAELAALGDFRSRPTLRARVRGCVGFTPRSGGCASLRLTNPPA